MIWNSLLLIFPILILVAALRCYKKDGRWMNAFYRRMSFHDVARRLYVQLVMLLLILFQFILPWYLQPIITQYFIDNKSEIWLLFLIAHSKR